MSAQTAGSDFSALHSRTATQARVLQLFEAASSGDFGLCAHLVQHNQELIAKVSNCRHTALLMQGARRVLGLTHAGAGRHLLADNGRQVDGEVLTRKDSRRGRSRPMQTSGDISRKSSGEMSSRNCMGATAQAQNSRNLDSYEARAQPVVGVATLGAGSTSLRKYCTTAHFSSRWYFSAARDAIASAVLPSWSIVQHKSARVHVARMLVTPRTSF